MTLILMYVCGGSDDDNDDVMTAAATTTTTTISTTQCTQRAQTLTKADHYPNIPERISSKEVLMHF